MVRDWISPLSDDEPPEPTPMYAVDSRGFTWFVLSGSNDPDEAQASGEWIKAANPARIRP